MKIMIALSVFLFTAVCSGVTYAQNQDQNQNQNQNQNNKPGAQNQNANQSAGNQPQSDADMLVRGTVVSTDPKNNQVVVTDYVSGYDRLFTVAESNVLKNIKKGDSVKVTPEEGRPDHASQVEKQQK